MARCPVAGCRVTPHGAFGYYRPDQVEQGVAGVRHWAWDLGIETSSVVSAPEAGVVDVARAADVSPWRGYGPNVVLIKGRSGVWHLLAHVDAIKVAVGDQVEEGQELARISQHAPGGPHTHWEVRRERVPRYSDFDRVQDAHHANNIDPAVWLAGASSRSSVALAAAIAAAALFALR